MRATIEAGADGGRMLHRRSSSRAGDAEAPHRRAPHYGRKRRGRDFRVAVPPTHCGHGRAGRTESMSIEGAQEADASFTSAAGTPSALAPSSCAFSTTSSSPLPCGVCQHWVHRGYTAQPRRTDSRRAQRANLRDLRVTGAHDGSPAKDRYPRFVIVAQNLQESRSA